MQVLPRNRCFVFFVQSLQHSLRNIIWIAVRMLFHSHQRPGDGFMCMVPSTMSNNRMHYLLWLLVQSKCHNWRANTERLSELFPGTSVVTNRKSRSCLPHSFAVFLVKKLFSDSPSFWDNLMSCSETNVKHRCHLFLLSIYRLFSSDSYFTFTSHSL